ncbi:hypothetical protein ATO6_12780 [Oceanicola sp. 22II-s10i]|nr:hypothetical protein ATO6_12780 [Oceanicola sp. 22II-s10i]
MSEYIEMLDTPKREHTNNGMPSPVGFELRLQSLNRAVASETGGTSGLTPWEDHQWSAEDQTLNRATP